MRSISTLILIVLALVGTAQTYNFTPQWKKGTKKTLNFEQNEREFENDVLISDTTIYNQAEIKVIDEDAESYTLKVVYENQALRAAASFYAKIGEELKDYRDLKLLFSIDKTTAEAELLNYEEAQDFMNKSIDQMTEIMEEKVPEMASFAGLLFMPIKSVFMSKENIEAYMLDMIGFMLVPYQSDYRLNESISTTTSQENPFSPSKEISATTVLTLVRADDDSGTYLIEQDIQLDLSEFAEMMKGMMQSMAESFGVNDSTATDKMDMVDDFKMSMTNIQSINYDSNSTWVTGAVKQGLVATTNPMDGMVTRQEISTITTID